MKTCSKCGIDKERSAFAETKRDGVNAACIECERARKRKYWNENSRILLWKQRKYQEQNQSYFVEYNRRTRERQR